MDSFTGVKTLHPQYLEHAWRWKKVRHAVAGTLKEYLRDVGKIEKDEKYGIQRQREYQEGAICYNFTKRTLSGMVGSVMRKDPEQSFPTAMDYLIDNCDGSGVGLWQHAQDTLMEIDSLGRGGLLVDAPDMAVATMSEQNAGLLNPVIAFYTAENVINWRLKRVGSVNKVVMVVLRETWEYFESDNEFKTKRGEQYRVLDIDEAGDYRQRIYKFKDAGGEAEPVITIYPDLKAVPKGEIPFTFVGASNNDSTVDDAPLLPLSELNIGHFRNSADSEENIFVTGQVMLTIAPGEGISNETWNEMNPDGVIFGARRGINLGYGGDAKLLQASPSTAARQGMLDKELQAVQIGAQLITPSQQITAESARLQRGADTSVMATIARNVSMAYQDALVWVAQMMGQQTEGIEFKLNMEFFLQPMTAQDIAQWVALVQGGYAPVEAMWTAMRKSGVTDFTDDELRDGIENAPLPIPGTSTTVTTAIPKSAQQEQQTQGDEVAK